MDWIHALLYPGLVGTLVDLIAHRRSDEGGEQRETALLMGLIPDHRYHRPWLCLRRRFPASIRRLLILPGQSYSAPRSEALPRQRSQSRCSWQPAVLSRGWVSFSSRYASWRVA